MSAIWGMIRKQNTIPDFIPKQMKSGMKSFQIEEYREIVQDTVYFACGQQYFTQEDHKEKMPLYDEARHILFTADCVLSNRKELEADLRRACSGLELETMGDGQLSYTAYVQWGETFVEHLRGSFSFAVYDMAKKELFLYADHFARRYLTYYICSDYILFSTAYQPVLEVLGKGGYRLNRRWIASAYTDCTADVIKLPGETVYEDIFHVEPGNYIKIHVDAPRVEHHTYWNPLRSVKKNRKKSDEEYKEMFLTTFQSAVHGLLRTDGEVGILLSGGLDSSSVAAFAAPELEKNKKKLFSYTSVPAEGYSYQNTRLEKENETEYILAQQKTLKNLCPRFVDAGGKNCFADMEDYVSYYGKPVKPIINMVNIDAMMQNAALDGCKVMLSGQNGNATISYGRILTYVYQKLCSGQVLAAYHEFRCFCKRHRVAGKHFLKIFFETFWEEKLQRYRLEDDCFLKKEDIRRYHLEKQERNLLKKRGNGTMDSKRQRMGFCFMPLVYQHMGFYDTYNSLRYGILSVDPTLTKEMVELCMSLPIDCFVKNGKERRAVRDYMKGYVPDIILENYAGRGVQAADFAFRVNRDWDTIKDEVERLLHNPALLEYMDEDKLQQLLHEIKSLEPLDKTVIAKAAVVASLSAYLNVYQSGY